MRTMDPSKDLKASQLGMSVPNLRKDLSSLLSTALRGFQFSSSGMIKVSSLRNVLKKGMMGGVNNAKDYIDLMGFGYVLSDGTPVITDSVLQGGIVSVSVHASTPSHTLLICRYYLGTLVGAFFGGWFGERYGRIKTIACGAAWATLGATLQCSSQNHNWMICGQFPFLCCS